MPLPDDHHTRRKHQVFFPLKGHTRTSRDVFSIRRFVDSGITSMLTEVKHCQECGDAIKGRPDKRFCSDQCRVTYNNRLNSDENNYVRNINNLIRRNRRILTTLTKSGKTKVSRTFLNERGFDFGYFTSTDNAKNGSICYYCYEQGYVPVEHEYFLLVTKEDLIS